VSLPLASVVFGTARHFLLDVCLEGIVKFFTMLLAVNAHFFGKLVEGLEALSRPSTWQKIGSSCTANQSVSLLGGLGEPRRLSTTMRLAEIDGVMIISNEENKRLLALHTRSHEILTYFMRMDFMS
jgi:hypothetical protein